MDNVSAGLVPKLIILYDDTSDSATDFACFDHESVTYRTIVQYNVSLTSSAVAQQDGDLSYSAQATTAILPINKNMAITLTCVTLENMIKPSTTLSSWWKAQSIKILYAIFYLMI